MVILFGFGAAHATEPMPSSPVLKQFYAFWSDPISNYGKEPKFPLTTDTILIDQDKPNTTEKFELFQKSGYTNFVLAKRQDFSVFISVRDNLPDQCLPFEDETGTHAAALPNSVILIPELNSVTEMDFQYSCEGLQSDNIRLYWIEGEKWPLISLDYGYPYGIAGELYKFNPTTNKYEKVQEYSV